MIALTILKWVGLALGVLAVLCVVALAAAMIAANICLMLLDKADTSQVDEMTDGDNEA